MPMGFSRSVLVTGATGQQGGAVTRKLLQRGHRVTAFIHHPDSPAARELESLGAELVVGDYDDLDSIAQAAQDMDTMFATATPLARAACRRRSAEGAGADATGSRAYSTTSTRRWPERTA